MGNHIMFYKCLVYMGCSKNTSQGFSCSRSDGGQIQGSIGAVISHNNRTYSFLSARYLASFAARIVFPSGLPQTAKTLHAEFLLLFFLCLSCKDTLLLEIQQFIPPRPLLSPQLCFLRILLHLFLLVLLSRVSLLFLPAYQ